MAQDNHLALLRRQHIHQSTDFFMRLAADNRLLSIVFRRLQHIENVEGIGCRNMRAPLVAAEIVHTHIVRNAHGPLKELALVVVFALSERINDFDENFLKNILSQTLIFHKEIDRSVNLLLVAIEEFLEGLLVTFEVTGDELLVIERRNFHN